jgi:hypothetical protein
MISYLLFRKCFKELLEMLLFARAGEHKGHPRAPHSSSHLHEAAAAKEPMEHSNVNGGSNRGSSTTRYGGSSTGQGAGQGPCLVEVTIILNSNKAGPRKKQLKSGQRQTPEPLVLEA